MVLSSFSFCLSGKLLISPSYLNEILAGYNNLGCRLFSFITLSCLAIPSWPEAFLLKDQLLSLWESPCVLFVVFLLLILIFVLCVWSSLIWLKCVLGCFTLGLSSLGLSLFLGLRWLFLPHFREVFNYYLLKFSHGLSFCLFFWNSYVSNVGAFNIVPEVSEIVLFSFKRNSF